MPIKRLNFKGAVENREAAAEMLKDSGDAVLIFRGIERWLILVCPCGCMEHIPVNLDPRMGPAWRLYRTRQYISLFPSVWRDSGCQSHFILLRNSIFLFDDGPSFDIPLVDPSLPDRILQSMVANIPVHYSELAEKLGEIPWDVDIACGRLVRERRLESLGRKGPGVYVRRVTGD